MTKLNVWDDGRVELPPSPDHVGGTDEKRARRQVIWKLLGCSYSHYDLRARIVAHNKLPIEQRSAFLHRLHALAAYLGVAADKLKREVPGGNSTNNNNPKDLDRPASAGNSKPSSSSSYFRKDK